MKKFIILFLLFPLFLEIQSTDSQKKDLNRLFKIASYATLSSISGAYSIFLLNSMRRELKQYPLFSIKQTIKIIHEYLKGKAAVNVHDEKILENYKTLYVQTRAWTEQNFLSKISKFKEEEASLRVTASHLAKNFELAKSNYHNLLKKLRLQKGFAFLPIATFCAFMSYKAARKAISISQEKN